MCARTPSFPSFPVLQPTSTSLTFAYLPTPSPRNTHTHTTPPRIHPSSFLTTQSTLKYVGCAMSNLSTIYYPKPDRTLGRVYKGLRADSTSPHPSQANINMQADFGFPWSHTLLIHSRARSKETSSHFLLYAGKHFNYHMCQRRLA